MVLNKEKKKKLADLVAKHRAAAGVGNLTPANPPPCYLCSQLI